MQAEEKWQVLTTMLYYAAVGALIYFGFRYAVPWLLPFLLGVTIAALLRPLTLAFSKKCRAKEKLSAGIVLLLFYLAAAGAILLFATIMLSQLYELLLRLPGLYADSIAPLLDRMGGWFNALLERFNAKTGAGVEQFSDAVSSAVQQAAVDGSAHLVSWAAGIAAKLPMLLLTAVFTIMISAITALNYREVGKLLCGMVPPRFAKRLSGLQRFLRETVWQYVRAYTIIMAVTFTELAAGLLLLRFDYALTVAAAITLLDVLPLIGSGAVLVPWGLVLLAGGDLPGGIGLLLLFGLIAVVRNIIEPRVVGKQIGLHPIATITLMYAGLKIAGVVGMLCAPVAALLLRHLKDDGAAA